MHVDHDNDEYSSTGTANSLTQVASEDAVVCCRNRLDYSSRHYELTPLVSHKIEHRESP